MNSFLVQVGLDKKSNVDSYANIMDNRRYANPRWLQKPRDKCHGMVESGDRLLVYCNARCPKPHKLSLAFSVDVKSVSEDRTTFILGKPQEFSNPLEYNAIDEHIEQGELHRIFYKCGTHGFNIIKLNQKAVEQILRLVG